jgi:ABC-type polysaccharide/polyol phosphate transport system ATPase subunit
MPNISIKATNISKKFDVRKEKLFPATDSFFKKTINKYFTKQYNEFWALKDISFEIYEGESVGIIGMNGAGKSTLLKILSDIIRPTTGKIEIAGQLAAILEIGIGFHPELSGRDNILLYGKILGFTKKQIEAKFDEIVEFSEIRAFIDNPIKHYSSGMLMRLGFSVIAFLETDIIILDEMLAVGDINFKSKCINKIIELKNSKRTIVIVSHDINEISNYCDRMLLLHEGQLVDSGASTNIINKYQEVLMQDRALTGDDRKNKFRNNNMNLLYIEQEKNLKTFIDFEKSDLHVQSSSFKIISASVSSLDKAHSEPNVFPVNNKILISVKVKYLGGKGDLAVGIADFMSNRIFVDFVFMRKEESITSKGVFQLNWIIPPDILNEGIFKVGMVLYEEKYLQGYTLPELLIFKTIDVNKVKSEFAFFTPIKPLIEFNYNKLE